MKLQYHPGKIHKGNDYHYFRLYRKEEVIKTLRKIPLRHPEKVAIKHLILSKKFARKQKGELYRKYRDHIEQEVEKNVKEAEKEYRSCH